MTREALLTQIETLIGRPASPLAFDAANSEISQALDVDIFWDDCDPPSSNEVLDNFPALYLYGVLAHHAALVRDEAAAVVWRGTFEQQKRLARASAFGADLANRRAAQPVAPMATP